jgi:hypothetical protein
MAQSLHPRYVVRIEDPSITACHLPPPSVASAETASRDRAADRVAAHRSEDRAREAMQDRRLDRLSAELQREIKQMRAQQHDALRGERVRDEQPRMDEVARYESVTPTTGRERPSYAPPPVGEPVAVPPDAKLLPEPPVRYEQYPVVTNLGTLFDILV